MPQSPSTSSKSYVDPGQRKKLDGDTDVLPIRRALVSVYDKTGLDRLAAALKAAGIVAAVGDGGENIEIGDRVFAMTGLGAFSEKIVAPKHAVVKIPDSMDFETAAALPMTYGTSLYALKQRAELKEGETLLVLSLIHI